MNGELPRDAPSLMKVLPGVGRYTAAAIASIAFNEPVGLVDGNVVRVLSRLRIIGTDCSSTVAVEMFWKLVDETVAKDRPGDFNQAIMELGARVCTPKSPQCNSCPVREICLANKQAKQFMHKKESQIKSFFDSIIQTEDCDSDVLGDIEELRSNDCQLCLPKDSTWDTELGVCNYPRKAKAKEARQERVAVCVLECHADNDIMLFLVKRPLSGLLAGLWEFPNFLVKTDLSDKALVTKVKEFMMEEFEIILPESQKVSHLGEVVHLFSHVHHTYIVHKIVLTTKPEVLYGESVDGRNTKWVPESKFLEMAISTGMKKVYNLRRNNGQQKKSGGKRKREEKDGSKKQKCLESFFVKT
jgi:A/G-specific adenine glycosylase